MEGVSILDPDQWAARHFGGVALSDGRRNRRALQLATAMSRRPGASLPAQLADPAALKAAYRLFENPAVTQAAVAQPHWNLTRQQAIQQPLVLLGHDTTELDDSHYPLTSGADR